MDVSVSVGGQRSTEERWAQVDRDAREPARARGEIQIIGSESKCRVLLGFQCHAGSSVDVANETQNMMKMITRPSVNYAKDWLDQYFLIPCPVWKRVSTADVITIWRSRSIFLCIRPYWAWGKPEKTGDHSASQPLTSGSLFQNGTN